MAIKDLGNGKFRIDLRIGGRRGTRHRATIAATSVQAHEAHADLLRASQGCTGASLRDAYIHAMATKFHDQKDRQGVEDRWRVLTSIVPEHTLLVDVDSALLVRLLTTLRAREIVATTINKYLSLVRVIFAEAVKAKPALILESQVPVVPHLKERQKKRRPFKADEEQAVIAWLCSQQDDEKWGEFRDFTVFQLDCGTRADEAHTLERVDVDLRAGEVRIRDPKNSEERIVPLSLRARQVVERRLAAIPKGPKERLFPAMKEGLRAKRWSECRTALGLQDLCIHSMRHTAGKRLIDATGNVRVAQKWLGHKRIETTVRYTEVDAAALHRAAEAISAVTTLPQADAD